MISQGIDVGISVAATPALRLEGSISRLDFTVLDVHVGDAIRSNTPRWKGTLGLSYAGPRADLNVTARFVGSFDWALGAFLGNVPSSRTANVAGGYRVNRSLRVHAVVTNFFDQKRFHTFGGSVIGRRAGGGDHRLLRRYRASRRGSPYEQRRRRMKRRHRSLDERLPQPPL